MSGSSLYMGMNFEDFQRFLPIILQKEDAE